VPTSTAIGQKSTFQKKNQSGFAYANLDIHTCFTTLLDNGNMVTTIVFCPPNTAALSSNQSFQKL